MQAVKLLACTSMWAVILLVHACNMLMQACSKLTCLFKHKTRKLVKLLVQTCNMIMYACKQLNYLLILLVQTYNTLMQACKKFTLLYMYKHKGSEIACTNLQYAYEHMQQVYLLVQA